MDTAYRPVTVGTATLLAVLTLSTGGCSSAQVSACYPSPLEVSSQRVPAGGSVTLSSPPFACQAGYRAGKTYTVLFAQPAQTGPLHIGDVPVNRDGSFSASIRIPAGASPGDAALTIMGSAFDRPCKDTVSASCAAYAIGITVLPRGPQ